MAQLFVFKDPDFDVEGYPFPISIFEFRFPTRNEGYLLAGFESAWYRTRYRKYIGVPTAASTTGKTTTARR